MKSGWKPGDAPEAHPLWERQVNIEMEMVERGAQRYRDKVGNARDKQEMTAIRPYRRLLEDMVSAMGEGTATWLNASRKRGKPGLASKKLVGMDPFILAFVTARTVLDTITIQRMSVHFVAKEIGRECEYEARMAAWVKRTPKLFAKVQGRLTNQKATAQHRKRVNIHEFNKLMREKVKWRDWTPDERLHVGLKLLDILARTTGHVSVMPDPAFKRNGIKTAPYIVVGSDELLTYLEESTAHDAARSPVYYPCVIPPKRWNGVRQGGYYSPMVRVPRLIRFKAENEEIQGAALEEYDHLEMQHVYAALDKVQEVAWRINRKVLNVAWECWERNLPVGRSMPKREPLDLPVPLPGQRRDDLTGQARRDAEEAWRKANPKKFVDWKREAAKVYGANARRASLGHGALTTMEIADKFIQDEFYFPHMLDFRGRMYPIPAYLEPQGNDLARGLLTFAHGQALGENGAFWLGVHLANCWGNDKITFGARYNWALEQWELWKRIAENPMGNLEWTMAGDPWQSLAAVFEFVRIAQSEDPARETSSLPIRVDGTCNGIQHLSAMMRDPVGGASVNLLPSEEPRDIYGEVAGILNTKLEEIRDSGGREGTSAAQWMKAFAPDGVPRKFTKNPVMVTPYGGTKDSFKGSVLGWLQDNNPKAIPDRRGRKYNERFEATLWIVPHLSDSIKGRVQEAMRCMEWLQKCARVVSETGQPIWWTTSVGFVVRHFYGRLQKRRIKTKIDGKTVYLVAWERSKKMSKKDQLQGIAPNFVHSQDGAVNMETILQFMHDGRAADAIPPFTTIHDSFGTVAGEMDNLFGCIRDAFVRIHQEDVMDAFRKRCVAMMTDHYAAVKPKWSREECWVEADGVVPRLPDRGTLNIEEVRQADYFFA